MPNPDPCPLILASTSVYRRHLLERLRLPFTVVASQVDETPLPDETPAQMAMRLALAKARAVARQHPQAVVIGSDQVADLNGQALGCELGGKEREHQGHAPPQHDQRSLSPQRGLAEFGSEG